MALPQEIAQTEARIESNRDKFSREAKAILANDRFTEQARREAVDESHAAYKAQHDADVGRIMELREEHKQTLRRNTLGPPIPMGLTPQQEQGVRQEFRELQDRADRVAKEEGHSGLDKLHERDVVLGGSNTAAAAIFTVAREHGFGEIVDRYLAAHPNDKARLEELDELEREDSDPFWFGFRYYGPIKPTDDPGFARVAGAMRGGR